MLSKSPWFMGSGLWMIHLACALTERNAASAWPLGSLCRQAASRTR